MCARLLACAVLGAAPPSARASAQEEDILIIEEDVPPSSSVPAPGAQRSAPTPAADDDVIVIEEDSAAPEGPTGPPRPDVPGLLGRLPGASRMPPAPFDLPDLPLPLSDVPPPPGPGNPTAGQSTSGRSFLGLRPEHVSLTGTFGVRSSVRPMGTLKDDVWRNLAFATASLDIRPDAPLRLHADLWVRARNSLGVLPVPLQSLSAVDVALPWRRADPRNRFSGMVELGELYATARLSRVRLTAGRQLFAWTSALTSPLPSLLNPPDLRDGVAAPDELTARSPVAALTLSGALGPLLLTGTVAPFHAPPRAPLFAEDAEAYDLNEPVLPLFQSRASTGAPDAAASLQRGVPYADQLQVGALSPTVGAQAFFTALGWDVTLSGVLGHDPLPVVTATPSVARALALAADRAPSSRIGGALTADCVKDRCPELNGALRLGWRRTAALQAEGSRAVGPAVVRASVFGIPRMGEWGRGAHVVTADGRLGNASLWNAGGSVALESGYTEWVQGFVELGYEVLWGIPAGARLARYEPAVVPFPAEHGTHRPTVSMRLQGVLLDDITWRVRATASPWQRDLMVVPRVGYRLSLQQEVTAGVELFTGWKGSRGAFLMPQSRGYLEWVYRF